jgi:multiple sugar transport system substrate-binding protein
VKKLLRVFAALVAIGVPGGCASGEGEAAAIQLMLFGDPVETEGYKELIAAFEDTDPGVTVNLTPVADQDELLAKLSTAFAGGTPPDTFLINYRRYGVFAGEDALEPVQSYLDDSEAISEDEYAPAALDAFRFDGETLTCMPQNVSSLVVYYNADLFEEVGLERPAAGWTWDDFLAAAKALTTGDNYGVGVEPSVIRVAPFAWSNGGEIVDDPVTPTTLTFDDPETEEALNFFLDLQTEHGVVPPQREELSLDAESRFLGGGLGMFMDSRKAVPTLRTIEDFEWDVAPLPVAPGGEPASILHGDAYCMSADSPNKEATWKFIEFAMGVEGQTILAESGRTVPSRLDVAESPAFLDSDEGPASSQVFVDAVPHIRAVPHTATWSTVEGEAGTILEGMFYGTLDRQEGLEQLQSKTAPLFDGG